MRGGLPSQILSLGQAIQAPWGWGQWSILCRILTPVVALKDPHGATQICASDLADSELPHWEQMEPGNKCSFTPRRPLACSDPALDTVLLLVELAATARGLSGRDSQQGTEGHRAPAKEKGRHED